MTFIKDLLHPKKAFKRNFLNYISQFKKEYRDRNIQENIIVNALYKIEFENSTSERYLGLIESILILEKYINPTINLSEITIHKKETYKDIIIRIAKTYLKDKNVL